MVEAFRVIWVSANQTDDDEELSSLIDTSIHYAMAFVNPKGVEIVLSARRMGDAYKGFTFVNKDAEEKTRKARAGEIIEPHPDRSIAEKVRRKRERSAKVVKKSTTEVDA